MPAAITMAATKTPEICKSGVERADGGERIPIRT